MLRPRAVDDAGFTVATDTDDDGRTRYRCAASKPLRWVRQTDFSNDEAVGYLADRLARLGVEEALTAAGAVAGDTVLIGSDEDGVVFDWEPTVAAGCRAVRAARLRPPARRPVAPPAASRCQVRLTESTRDPRRRDAPRGGGRPPGRRQGRLVVADHRRGGIDADRGRRASSTPSPQRRRRGHEVVLVSSGAIAAGLAPLGLSRRPRDLATQQAAASVGQGAAGARATPPASPATASPSGRCCSPPTTSPAARTTATPSAPCTGCSSSASLPIVNENDTVATDEIRFGDNDRLAALVAHLVHADAARAALRRRRPLRRRPAPRRTLADRRGRGPQDLAGVRVGRAGAGVGTGGMATKVEAARIATAAGIPVVLAAAAAAAPALAGDDGRHVLPPDRARAPRPGCSGWRTRPTARAG